MEILTFSTSALEFMFRNNAVEFSFHLRSYCCLKLRTKKALDILLHLVSCIDGNEAISNYCTYRRRFQGTDWSLFRLEKGDVSFLHTVRHRETTADAIANAQFAIAESICVQQFRPGIRMFWCARVIEDL